MFFKINFKTLSFFFSQKSRPTNKIMFVCFFKGNKISPWVCVRVCSVIKLSPVSFPIHPGKYQKRLGKGCGTYLCLERARGGEYGGWGWGYRAEAPKSARALPQCRGPRDPLCSHLLLRAKIRPQTLKTKHSLQQLASDGLNKEEEASQRDPRATCDQAGMPQWRVTERSCGRGCRWFFWSGYETFSLAECLVRGRPEPCLLLLPVLWGRSSCHPQFVCKETSEKFAALKRLGLYCKIKRGLGPKSFDDLCNGQQPHVVKLQV